MESAKKTVIESKKVTITGEIPTYGELIAKEKRALPDLTRRLNENARKQRKSTIIMRKRSLN